MKQEVKLFIAVMIILLAVGLAAFALVVYS